MVVASPVEDYFLYIDDLPDPEKVRIQTLSPNIYQVEGSDVISPVIHGRKKPRKLRDHFWMLLVMTIQFVARV